MLNLKFSAEVKIEELSLSQILHEVNEGLRCMRAMQEIFLFGDSPNRYEPLNSKGFYIEEVFKHFYEYVVNTTFRFTESETELMDAIGFVHAFAISVEIFGFDKLRQCESVILYAAARAKIDHVAGYPTWDVDGYQEFIGNGSDGKLTISEVALLASMNEKSVRNATQQGKQDRLITQKTKAGVYINAEDALDWLKRRQSFRPTKYPEKEMVDDGIERVLVPKAFDGSFFSASCKQGKGYKIGKKGEEIYVESVWEALKVLKSMPKAYWRRQNEHGNYGIVSAQEWVEIERETFLST